MKQILKEKTKNIKNWVRTQSQSYPGIKQKAATTNEKTGRLEEWLVVSGPVPANTSGETA